MTGLTRQQAAKAVADLFGTSARRTFESAIYDPWEVIDREGKKWRFVFDSSIKAAKRIHGHQVPVDIGLYKVEMNSPKLEYSEMGKLQEVVRALRHAGAVVNGSCGMHVHVDASHHTPQSLKNALSIMYSKEDILFKALNVNEARVQRWCQKVREPMLEKIRKLPTNRQSPGEHHIGFGYLSTSHQPKPNRDAQDRDHRKPGIHIPHISTAPRPDRTGVQECAGTPAGKPSR